MTIQQAPECCEVLINGRAISSVSPFERALHYGDGIFETIALKDGKLQFLPKHLQRLRQGAERLGIEFKDGEKLIAELNTITQGKRRGVVKIILTRGNGGRGYQPPENSDPTRLVYSYPWPTKYDEIKGLRVMFCKTMISRNPALAGIKHLNRLENVLARSEWSDEFDEGLMSDSDGHWIEGTMSNLFWVNGGSIYTPQLDDCGVNGIIRSQVLDIASNVGIQCKGVICADRSTLLNADEVFMTNALIGIMPVIKLETKEFMNCEVTKMLRDQLVQRIADE